MPSYSGKPALSISATWLQKLDSSAESSPRFTFPAM
jgi:hypothetical protein